MASVLLKRYLEILLEAMSFSSLNDAGEDYTPGNTQIWYTKTNFSREMSIGYDALKRLNKLPNINDLSKTHTLIGNIAESNPEKIYSLMQAESWSPQGQGRSLIQKAGADHTSMSVGDILIIGKQILMVDRIGFTDLISGEEV